MTDSNINNIFKKTNVYTDSQYYRLLQETAQADNFARSDIKSKDKKKDDKIKHALSELEKNILEMLDGSDTGMENLENTEKEKEKIRSSFENMQRRIKAIINNSPDKSNIPDILIEKLKAYLKKYAEPKRSQLTDFIFSMLNNFSCKDIQETISQFQKGTFNIDLFIKNLKTKSKINNQTVPNDSIIIPLPSTDVSYYIEKLRNGSLWAMCANDKNFYIVNNKQEIIAGLIEIQSEFNNNHYIICDLDSSFKGQRICEHAIREDFLNPNKISNKTDKFHRFSRVRINKYLRIIAFSKNDNTKLFLLKNNNTLDVASEVKLVDGCFYPIIYNKNQEIFINPYNQNLIRILPLLNKLPNDNNDYAAVAQVKDKCFEIAPTSHHIIWEIKKMQKQDLYLRIPTRYAGIKITPYMYYMQRAFNVNQNDNKKSIFNTYIFPKEIDYLEKFTYDALSTEDNLQTIIYYDKKRIERRYSMQMLDYLPNNMNYIVKNTSLLFEKYHLKGRTSKMAEKIKMYFINKRKQNIT